LFICSAPIASAQPPLPPSPAQNAFLPDQDTIHFYPFVCAGLADAVDTIGGVPLSRNAGVHVPRPDVGFCDAYSQTGLTNFLSSTNIAGNVGTFGFTITFLDHGDPADATPNFMGWTQDTAYLMSLIRDGTDHMCVFME
jgi:hypothetical protein